MIAEVLFIFWRLTEIVFLIPIIGMLAYFVNGFLNANQLTPAYILVLFIVSTIAVFWCIDTILRFGSTRRSAVFVSFLDLCFFGALIAGVYQLRFIADVSCTSWSDSTSSVSLGPFGSIVYTGETPNFNKTCSMLKASFAMGIMEVVFFFITAFFALLIHRHHHDTVVKETVVRRRSHSSRRGHHHSRSGSSSRRHYVV